MNFLFLDNLFTLRLNSLVEIKNFECSVEISLKKLKN